MENEEYPYQEEWESYRDGNALGCLLVPVIIGLILLWRHFSPQLPDYIGGVLFVVFMVIVFIQSFFYQGGWKCPRCREDFDHQKRIKPTKKCVHCGLPIYYGSSYFYDHWGTEQGNDLIEKVRKKEI
jgi:hypothetical protein